jgi:hypothetical protein
MSTTLFGLNRKGEVVHTESVAGCEVGELHALASRQLALFHTVEIWIESVRVATVSRFDPAQVASQSD